MFPSNQFTKPSFMTNTTTNTFGTAGGVAGAFGGSPVFGSTNVNFPQCNTTFGQSSLTPFSSPNTSSNANLFNSSTPVFGGSSFTQQQTPISANTLFGSTNAFSAPQKSSFGFPSTSSNQINTLFGQTQQSTPASTSTMFQPLTSNLFSQSSAFNSQLQSGTVIKFLPVTGSDTMVKNGVTQAINTKHYCITCMKEYEMKSLEELRLEDYLANRKGAQQTTFVNQPLYGGTATCTSSIFAPQPSFVQSTGFGQTAANTFGQSTSTFGLNSGSTGNMFGQAPPFTASSVGGSGFSGGFTTTASTSSPFNTQQQRFSTGQTPFSVSSIQQQSSPFTSSIFGNTAQPNATTQQSQSIFGANVKPSNQFATFGTNTLGVASNSSFGQQMAPSAIGTNAFAKLPSVFNQNLSSTTGGANSIQPINPSSIFNTNTSTFPQQQSFIGGGGVGGSSVFNTSVFNSNQPSSFLLQNPSQTTFPSYQPHEVSNLSAILTDIYPDGPHSKLEPRFDDTLNTTNPQVINEILNAQAKLLLTRSNSAVCADKLPVQSFHSRKPFINNIHKELAVWNTSPHIRGSRKHLVIEKHRPGENFFTQLRNNYEMSGTQTNSEAKSCSSTESTSTKVLFRAPDKADKRLMDYAKQLSPGSKLLQQTYDYSDDGDDIFIPRETAKLSNAARQLLSLIPQPSTSPSTESASTDTKTSETNALSQEPSSEQVTSPTVEIPTTLPEETTTTHPAGIILNRSEYYMIPSVNELQKFVDDCGDCKVQGLTIGRTGYGNVHFPDEINIRDMNFDEIVHIHHKEIIVYPNEKTKPPIGEGLNRIAQITLDKVYPRVKDSMMYITNVNDILESGFVDNLMVITRNHGCRFVEYRPETGSWVFRVQHFSKYGITDSDDEFCSIPNYYSNPRNERCLSSSSSSTTSSNNNNLIEKAKQISQVPNQQQFVGLSGFSSFTTANMYADNECLLKNTSMFDSIESVAAHLDHPSLQNFVRHDTKQVKCAQEEMIDSRIYKEIFQNSKMDTLMTETDDDIIANACEFIYGRTLNIEPFIASTQEWTVAAINNIRSIPERCCTDIMLFKSRCYKVGWTKTCNIYGVEINGDDYFLTEYSDIQSYNTRYEKMMPSIDDIMSDIMDQVEFHFESDGVPTATIINSELFLKNQLHLYANHANDCRLMNYDRYLVSIWELCQILWCNTPVVNNNPSLVKRHALSKWLMKYITTDDQLTKNSNIIQTKDNKISWIFKYLTENRIKDALKVAKQLKLHRLSLLLSQLSCNEYCKTFSNQLVAFGEFMHYMPPDVKKNYFLLAGLQQYEDIGIPKYFDWKRIFGVHLWYLTPAECTILDTIEIFTKAFDNDLITKPKPLHLLHTDFVDNMLKDYDIIYELIVLYVRGNSYLLTQILNTNTHTPNVLDYRLSWSLLLLFQSLQVGLFDEVTTNYIHIAFAQQLQSLGYWKWALLVLMFCKDNTLKRQKLYEMLVHYFVLCNNNDEEDKDDIFMELPFPPKWRFAIEGDLCSYQEDIHEALYHFLCAENWEKCNKLLITDIIPKLFLNQQYDVVTNIIDLMPLSERRPLQWTFNICSLNHLLNPHQSKHENKNEIYSKSVLTMFNQLPQNIARYPINTLEQRIFVAQISQFYSKLFVIMLKHQNKEDFNRRYLDIKDYLRMPPDYKFYELFYNINICL